MNKKTIIIVSIVAVVLLIIILYISSKKKIDDKAVATTAPTGATGDSTLASLLNVYATIKTGQSAENDAWVAEREAGYNQCIKDGNDHYVCSEKYYN